MIDYVSSLGFYLRPHELKHFFFVAVEDGRMEKVRSVVSPLLTQGYVIRREFFMNFEKVQLHRWSAVTCRITLAMFTRSPAAYEALKGYQILNLPSVASLKQFTEANKQAPGFNLPHLHDAKQTHAAYKVEQREQGFLEPNDNGVLIFDEVKEVKEVMKVHWNSADNG